MGGVTQMLLMAGGGQIVPYADVSLLLFGDGVNNGTVFTDSSSYAHVMGSTGNVVTSTTLPMWGTASILFDGTTDQVFCTSDSTLDISSGDFTLQFWFKSTNTTLTNRRIYTKGSDTATVAADLQINVGINSLGALFVGAYSGSTVYDLMSTAWGKYAYGGWHFFELIRSGNTWTTRIDGVILGTTTFAATLNESSAWKVRIGSFQSAAIYCFPGRIDTLRLIKGAAVTYGSERPYSVFPSGYVETPPTPSGIADAYFENVVLSVPCTGSSGSTTFFDRSVFEHNVTAANNTQVNTTYEPWSGGAALFDGVDDYLTIPNNSIFDIGAKDFTFECMMRLNDTIEMGLYSQWGASSNKALFISAKTDQLKVYWTTDGTTNLSASVVASLATGTWYHYRVCRIGTDLYFFIDGTQVGSTQTMNATVFSSTAVVEIGTNVSGAAYDWNGSIAHVRFTMGVGRSSTSFTPPTAAFPTTSEDNSTDPYWSNVALLVHGGGSSSGTVIIDNGPNSFSINRSAGCVTGWGKRLFSRGSIWMGNGATTGFNVADNALLEPGSGNFTMEFFVYFTNVASPNQQVMMTKRATAGFGTFHIDVVSSTLRFLCSTNGTSWGIQDLTCGTLSSGQWYHIALVRNGSNFDIYTNGVSTGSASSASALVNNTNALTFGTDNDNSSDLNGYMDEIRYTVGVARYTGTFTPPTRTFPNVGPKPLWTPTSLSNPPKIWLNELSSYTEVSGHTTDWWDYSGPTSHFTQTTTAQRPTGNASGINGMRTVTADGVDDRLVATAATDMDIFRNVTGYWIFAILKKTALDGSNTTRSLFMAATNTPGTSRFAAMLGFSGESKNKWQLRVRRADGDTVGILVDSSEIADTSAHLLGGTVEFSTRTGKLYRDTVEVASSTTLTSAGSNSSNTGGADFLGLFSQSNNTGWADIELAEIIIGTGSIPSSNERAKIEGYLAWRWGQQSLLPGGHTYASEPPYA